MLVDCQLEVKRGKMKAQPNRKEWMSPSALNPTTEVIKVVCSLGLEEMPEDVKALEEQIN